MSSEQIKHQNPLSHLKDVFKETLHRRALEREERTKQGTTSQEIAKQQWNERLEVNSPLISDIKATLDERRSAIYKILQDAAQEDDNHGRSLFAPDRIANETRGVVIAEWEKPDHDGIAERTTFDPILKDLPGFDEKEPINETYNGTNDLVMYAIQDWLDETFGENTLELKHIENGERDEKGETHMYRTWSITLKENKAKHSGE